MKKISGKYVLFQVGAVIGLSAVIAGITAIIGADFLGMFIVFLFILGMVCIIVNAYKIGFSRYLMKKTIEKNIKQFGFEDCHTFYSSSGTVKIDEKTGRIAYVAYMNPMKFQVISAKDIENIKSDYAGSPLGGTTYVYFAFSYQGKTLKVPTFTSTRGVYSLKSKQVLEAIAKADTFAEILRSAKSIAR